MNQFTIKNSNNTLTLDISSYFKNIDRAIEKVLNYYKKQSITIDCFEVNIVLRELLTNSMRHGNRSDPSKKVRIKLNYDKGNLQFVVKDEGKGFNPNEEIIKKSDVLTPHGMGLSIISSLGYNMKFNEEDKNLYVSKRLLKF